MPLPEVLITHKEEETVLRCEKLPVQSGSLHRAGCRLGEHMAQRWNSCLLRRNNSGASTIWVNYGTCNSHAYVAAAHKPSSQAGG